MRRIADCYRSISTEGSEDPQGLLVSAWQLTVLKSYCESYEPVRSLDVDGMARICAQVGQSLGLGVILVEVRADDDGTPFPEGHIAMFDAKNRSVVLCEPALLNGEMDYLVACHEVAHAWMDRAFAFVNEQAVGQKDGALMPVRAHGPIFVRAFLMSLSRYLRVPEPLFLKNAPALPKLAIDPDELMDLYTAMIETDFSEERTGQRAYDLLRACEEREATAFRLAGNEKQSDVTREEIFRLFGVETELE